MTTEACSMKRQPSYTASLHTLPINTELEACPIIKFGDLNFLEPEVNINWKNNFKDIFKIAKQGNKQQAVNLLRKAAQDKWVHPYYLAIVNLAIKNINKGKHHE